MAYSRGPTTALKSSASLLPGNLAVLIGVEGDRSLTYAVTHKNCANIVHIASGVCTQEQVVFDTSEDKDPASHLIQVSPLLCYLWYSLHSGPHLWNVKCDKNASESGSRVEVRFLYCSAYFRLIFVFLIDFQNDFLDRFSKSIRKSIRNTRDNIIPGNTPYSILLHLAFHSRQPCTEWASLELTVN